MLLAWLLAGCADPPLCEDAPVVTMETFGRGFLDENCQACHASTSEDRNGAPERIVFDTQEDVDAWAGSILAAATGESPFMPPEGGVTDDDRYRLEVMLSCE